MVNAERRLRKENNLQEKQLSEENNKILTDIIVYLHSANLCEYDIEIIRKELLGMVMEAQFRHETITDVIGEDYKGFCNELIKNGRQQTTYAKILSILDSVVMGVGIIFIYEIIKFIVTVFTKDGADKLTVELPITLGFTISTTCASFAAFGIFYYISNKSFELSVTSSKKYKTILFLVLFIILATTTLSRAFLDEVLLFSMNLVYILLFFIIAFTVINILAARNSNKLAETHK